MICDYRAILTKEGFKFPNALLNQNVRFVCPLTNQTIQGTVVEYPHEDVWRYELKPRQDTTGTPGEVLICSRPQRIALHGGRESEAFGCGFTHDMRKGDRIVASVTDAGYDAGSWGRGFMMACGVTHLTSLRLDEHPLYQNKLRTLIETNQITGAPYIPYDGTAPEISSFIHGYLSGSGWPRRLHTYNESFLDFFIENAGLAGLVITGKKNEYLTNCYETFRLIPSWSVIYAKGVDTKYFRVMSGPVKYDYPEKLYAVYLDNKGLYGMQGGWTLASD